MTMSAGLHDCVFQLTMLNCSRRLIVYRVTNETKSLSQIEKAAIDILLGIRKSGITYSQSVIDYLYQFMQEHTQYEYDRLLRCLKRAAEKELAQSDAHDSDRLISFHRIEQELKADLQQTPDQRIPKKVHSVPNC